MSSVPQEIWDNGRVLAWLSPIPEGVNYAYMNALCEKLAAAEPMVKFDNREWLGHVHYILYLGDWTLAKAAFARVTQGDMLLKGYFHMATVPDFISQPQYGDSKRWDRIDASKK